MTKLNRRPFGILMRRLLFPAICLIAVGASADNNLKPPPEAAFLSGVMKVADNWVLDYQTYEELDTSGDERGRASGEAGKTLAAVG